MDEAKMTDADMAQREKIVKSMKKNFKDFRSRYGARAKEVMYATATKMAMKEEETIDEALFYNPSPSHSPKAKNPKEKMSKELRKKMNYFRKKYGAEAKTKMDMKEEETIEEGEVKKANKEKKNEYVASIIQKKLHPSVLPSKAYGRRKLKEEETIEENKYSLPAGTNKPKEPKPEKSKSSLEKRFGHLKPGQSASLKGDPKEVKEEHPMQGSSVEKVPYKEMDMENLVQDAINDIPEDDGPHTSDMGETPNFATVAKPEDVVNQANNEGNRESLTVVASRKSGKPFKSFRARKMSYGPEDLSGAVASVAVGESVEVEEAIKDEADKGEYDYEGDMAKSSLRTIVRNAQMMHDMLDENTNLPEWVASKITLAEDYIVAAAQYMQSEMSEQVELDEISKELAWKAAEKAAQKAHVSSFAALTGKEPYKSKFEKAVRQHNKITAYASAKTPKVPFVQHKEEVEPVVEYQRGLWRPQEAGMKKSGHEKGKGMVTTYHYQKKNSNTPTGAKMTMGGVDVHMGTSKAKRRKG